MGLDYDGFKLFFIVSEKKKKKKKNENKFFLQFHDIVTSVR